MTSDDVYTAGREDAVERQWSAADIDEHVPAAGTDRDVWEFTNDPVKNAEQHHVTDPRDPNTAWIVCSGDGLIHDPDADGGAERCQ